MKRRMEALHHSDLAQRLLERMRRLIDGNHLSRADLTSVGHEGEDYGVDAWVVWQFSSKTTSRTVLGNGAIPGAHHGFDRRSLEHSVSTLCEEAAFGQQVRVPFMQRVVVAGDGALAWADTTQIVKDYGEQSVHRHCGSCGGNGDVSCGQCGGSGRRACSGCGGSGSRPTSYTTTHWNGRHHETRTHWGQMPCGGCGGLGRVVCFSCGGSGREQCSTCRGEGFFTDIIHVTGVAIPSWHVSPEPGLASEALGSCLQQIGPAESARHVPFGSNGTRYDGAERWIAQYRGIASVVELHCDLKGQQYDIAAVGEEPYPISRPPMFDYVLAAEIAALRQDKVVESRGPRLKGVRARMLFSDFRRLPVLDTALQSVAALQGACREQPESCVIAAAEGFISRDGARQLGAGMLAMLHKVSPPYSVLAWWAVLGLPVIVAFFGTEYLSETTRDWSSWALTAVLTTAAFLVTIGILSPLAWLMSALVSWARRLRVPPDYRQRGRNWEPRKYVYAGAVSACLLGAALAATIKLGWVPPLHDRSERTIHQISTRVLTLPFVQSWLSQKSGPVKPAPVMSDADLYGEIQRRLNESGYPVGRVDGRPGPRTVTQLAEYRKRERLPPDLAPREVLDHMRKSASAVGSTNAIGER